MMKEYYRMDGVHYNIEEENERIIIVVVTKIIMI